jgi:hypothetical protein
MTDTTSIENLKSVPNTAVPTPSNPSTLPPRFAIRQLGPEHSKWAAAIVMHSNLFHSPAWSLIYPSAITARLHKAVKAAEYIVDHQIDSGLSYGVFDTQYAFKNAASQATGGKLYWDENEPSVQETAGPEKESQRLVRQMDFPLVSVALSYDAINPLDLEKMGPLLESLPHYGPLHHYLHSFDTRDPSVYTPTAAGEVLFRNATSTRQDYVDHHLMSGTARWLMREAALKGFRGIQIEAVHDKVAAVWSKAEPPFKGYIASQVDMGNLEVKGVKPFSPATQVVSKIYVDLKPGA